MNYEALQLLVKSLVANFKCEMCKASIMSNDINIIGVEWKRVTLEIGCKKCNNKSLVKSEVITMDLWKMKLTSNQIMSIKNSIDKVHNKKNLDTIKDDNIIELDKNLKKAKFNVEDLFKL